MSLVRPRIPRSRTTNWRRGPVISGLLVALVGCAPPDDERCRSGWQYIDHTCIPDDTESSVIEGTDSDLPEGFGLKCTPEGGECEGLEASYCVHDPRKLKGYCTIQDCRPSNNDCPRGYSCCVFIIESEPSFCVTEAELLEMGGLCQE